MTINLPPPPNTTPLVADEPPSLVWARWFELFRAKQEECCAAGGGGGGATLSNATPADLGTAAAGVGTEAARSDHVHAHGNLAGGSLHAVAVASGAAGFLSGADKAKLDAIPGTIPSLTSSPPADIGTTAVGVATDAARADHVHAHGNLAGGSFHALAVSGVSHGFVSSTDQTKLDNWVSPGQIIALVMCQALV